MRMPRPKYGRQQEIKRCWQVDKNSIEESKKPRIFELANDPSFERILSFFGLSVLSAGKGGYFYRNFRYWQNKSRAFLRPWQELNLRPYGPQPYALSAELQGHKKIKDKIIIIFGKQSFLRCCAKNTKLILLINLRKMDHGIGRSSFSKLIKSHNREHCRLSFSAISGFVENKNPLWIANQRDFQPIIF